MNTHKIFTFLAFYASTFVAASSAAVWDVGGTWYQSLTQPSFTPPPWVFGPVWTVLYLMIAIVACRIAYAAETPWKMPALALWALQIALNTLWTPVFFGAKNLGGAMFYIGLLWVTICLLIWVTRKVDKLSAILLLPYLAWVSFAGILNFAFWALNP
ncbi:MAG: TspO/MBR family protein [Paracoccaceae bacterium]|jgi:benzodiazapine receptor